MTDEDIKAGLALCEAATPGPWTQGYDNDTGPGDEGYWEWHEVLSGQETVAKLSISRWDKKNDRSEADAAFIAQARTLLPEALRELERLRRVERAARDFLSLSEPIKLGRGTDAVMEYYAKVKEARAALRTALGDA